MINRALIRIKVIQILYSCHGDQDKTLISADQDFRTSLEKTYELYHWLLQLSVEIREYAVNRIEIGLNKMRPSDAERNPNTRFINNKLAKQLSTNELLQSFVEEKGISWEEHDGLIKSLYDKIVASKYYEEYMSAKESSYAVDRLLWRRLYKKVLLPNKELSLHLEGMDLFWNDDIETVCSFIDKTIKKFEPEENNDQVLVPMYRNDEDEAFAIKLFHTALKNKEAAIELIKESTQNWETERIALMDMVIMEAAIAELTDFPSIPVNVTLNEYIEISKFYSTEKSATFINGILDDIAKKLKKDNKLVKAKTISK